MKDNDDMPTATSATASSGCPVLARGDGDSDTSTAKSSGLWSRWFSRTDAPSADVTQPQSVSVSECPVKGKKSALPASIEEAANHSQIPAPGQRIPLSTQRVISSIPRGDNDADAPTIEESNNNKPSVPAHQPANATNWQYPSEQQFYNAMLRKGYRPPVESIPSVLQIHNAVNERSWLQVCKWEKELHDNEDPKLVKFVGRPKDLSPKAWWNSRIFMTQEPFDRHDWYVEDVEGGEPRRYVIDFYEGKEKTGDLASSLDGAAGGGAKNSNPPVMRPPSMYIDVRPALDNPSAAVDRIAMTAREIFPGLAGVWDSYKRSSTASNAAVAEMEGARGKDDSGQK